MKIYAQMKPPMYLDPSFISSLRVHAEVRVRCFEYVNNPSVPTTKNLCCKFVLIRYLSAWPQGAFIVCTVL